MKYVITLIAEGVFDRDATRETPDTIRFRSYTVLADDAEEVRRIASTLQQAFQLESQALGTLKGLKPEVVEIAE